jgi:hypothetical protein
MEMQTNSNAPKFAFYYLLSLLGLIFTAVSSGSVIFQIINKYVEDPLAGYGQIFNSEALKFAISAIIIAAPIYYILMWQINKSIVKGELHKDSSLRKWLTYFILFVSSVVVLGTLIGIINSYLDGDLTTQFILKSLAAITIAGIVFTYYFFDIKRGVDVKISQNFVFNKIYFYGSLFLVLVCLVSAFLLTESPAQTRSRKFDEQIVYNFEHIYFTLEQYYTDNKSLPATLDALLADKRYYLPPNVSKEPGTDNLIVYKIIKDNAFQLCANFKTTNRDKQSLQEDAYNAAKWTHDSGYQCIEQAIRFIGGK